MTDEQKKFLDLVTPPALAGERDTGIPASVTVAQAILESAWGRSRLFTEANNPFGIKHTHFSALEDYGEYVKAWTEEVEGGKLKRELAEFSHFASLENAFRMHSMLFLRLPRYKAAWAAKHDWRKFALEIARAGYSTLPFPEYADRLVKLVEEFHLAEAPSYAKPACAGKASEGSR